ncbi:hypothetical protein EMIT0P258_120200 [Pseudomonas sp. IT-P258]
MAKRARLLVARGFERLDVVAYTVTKTAAFMSQPVVGGSFRPKMAGGRCITIVACVWLSLINQGELKP